MTLKLETQSKIFIKKQQKKHLLEGNLKQIEKKWHIFKIPTNNRVNNGGLLDGYLVTCTLKTDKAK